MHRTTGLCPENVRAEENGTFFHSLQQRILGVRSIALVEIILFLSALVLLDMIMGNGMRFFGVEPHPFWIVVLIITLQYGLQEALAAALLSTIFLLAGNMPEQNMMETTYEYIMRVAGLPCLWLVMALALGSIRNRQICEKQALMSDISEAKKTLKTLANHYTAAKQSKEQLELRLAEERCSVLTVYQVAKSLETRQPVELQAAIMEMVRIAFNPAKFSLFRCRGNGLQLAASYGWDKSDAYLQQFALSSSLASALFKKQSVLNIINERDEAILADQGMLAGALVDDRTGNVFGMLKIEELGFVDLNSRTQEIFPVICAWIARAMANEQNHPLSKGRRWPNFAPQTLYVRPENRLVAA